MFERRVAGTAPPWITDPMRRFVHRGVILCAKRVIRFRGTNKKYSRPGRPVAARINPRWGPTIASRPVPPAMPGQDANLPVASNPPVAVASPAERRT